MPLCRTGQYRLICSLICMEKITHQHGLFEQYNQQNAYDIFHKFSGYLMTKSLHKETLHLPEF